MSMVVTCLTGEIKLNGLDTNVGGTGGHACGVFGSLLEVKREG